MLAVEQGSCSKHHGMSGSASPRFTLSQSSLWWRTWPNTNSAFKSQIYRFTGVLPMDFVTNDIIVLEYSI